MNVLEITVDLGPGASPVLVETLVRGVRVVADVGRDAALRRIRRAATEQMKFPTDDELVRAPEGWRVSLRRLHPFGPGSSLAVGYMPEFCLPGMGRDLYHPDALQDISS